MNPGDAKNGTGERFRPLSHRSTVRGMEMVETALAFIVMIVVVAAAALLLWAGYR